MPQNSKLFGKKDLQNTKTSTYRAAYRRNPKNSLKSPLELPNNFTAIYDNFGISLRFMGNKFQDRRHCYSFADFALYIWSSKIGLLSLASGGNI